MADQHKEYKDIEMKDVDTDDGEQQGYPQHHDFGATIAAAGDAGLLGVLGHQVADDALSVHSNRTEHTNYSDLSDLPEEDPVLTDAVIFLTDVPGTTLHSLANMVRLQISHLSEKDRTYADFSLDEAMQHPHNDEDIARKLRNIRDLMRTQSLSTVHLQATKPVIDFMAHSMSDVSGVAELLHTALSAVDAVYPYFSTNLVASTGSADVASIPPADAAKAMAAKVEQAAVPAVEDDEDEDEDEDEY